MTENTSTVSNSSVSAKITNAAIGAPAAIFMVWYINTYIIKGEMPLEVAAALGAVLTSITETVWHIGQQLFKKVGIDT